MYKYIIGILLASCTNAYASGYITMSLSDEYVSGNTRTCYYHNGEQEETITVRSSQQCPYTKTFESDE